MTPDELLSEWAGIIRDIVGTKGQWRKEPLTFDEWKAADDRWLALKQHELKKLTRGTHE